MLIILKGLLKISIYYSPAILFSLFGLYRLYKWEKEGQANE